MQLLKDSTVVIKNGVIKADDPLKMGIQNYADLTLDNVKIYGGPTITYTLSNNNGSVVLKNGTELHPYEGDVAFDVYYGMNKDGEYDDPGVHVTIADTSVVVDGPVEYGKARRVTDLDKFAQFASLTVPSEMDITFKSKPSDYDWVDNGDGTKSLKRQ